MTILKISIANHQFYLLIMYYETMCVEETRAHSDSVHFFVSYNNIMMLKNYLA